MIYKAKNTNMKGAPIHGVKLNKGETALNFNDKDEDGDQLFVIYTGGFLNGMEKRVKGKKLTLNFFKLFKSEIGILDENDKPTNQSIIYFRFHSSEKFCEISIDEHKKIHGGIHVRYFIYDGIDKTEQELIEWALNTDQLANDGKTNIYGANKIK